MTCLAAAIITCCTKDAAYEKYLFQTSHLRQSGCGFLTYNLAPAGIMERGGAVCKVFLTLRKFHIGCLKARTEM